MARTTAAIPWRSDVITDDERRQRLAAIIEAAAIADERDRIDRQTRVFLYERQIQDLESLAIRHNKVKNRSVSIHAIARYMIDQALKDADKLPFTQP